MSGRFPGKNPQVPEEALSEHLLSRSVWKKIILYLVENPNYSHMISRKGVNLLTSVLLLVAFTFIIGGYVLPSLADPYNADEELSIVISAPSDTTNITNDSFYDLGTRMVVFNYTPTWNASADINCTSLWINSTGTFVENQTNSTSLTNDTINNFTLTYLPDGVYLWNVIINDTNGDSDMHATNWTFTIDTVGPSFSQMEFSLESFIYNATNYTTLNLTWTDPSGIAEVWIEGNWSLGVMQNFSMTFANDTDGFPNHYGYQEIMQAGEWAWRSYARDTLGMWSVSDWKALTINRTTPTLTITPLTTVTYGTATTQSCNTTVGETTMLTMYRNGTQVAANGGTGVSEGEVVEGAGTWNYTCTYLQSMNYSNYTLANQDLTVHKDAISLAVSPTTQTTYYPEDTTQYCAGNSSAYVCTLWRNDVNITDLNDTVDGLPPGTYDYVANVTAPTENYTWTADASTLTKERGPVNITLWLNGTDGDAALTYPSDVNATCFVNISSQNTITMLMNGTPVSTQVGQTIEYNDDLPAEIYNFTCIYAQTQNYSMAVRNYDLTLNQGTPSLTVGPTSTLMYPAQTETGCQKVSADASSVMALLLNGTTVAGGATTTINQTALTLGAATYNYTCGIAASENFTATTLSNQYRIVQQNTSAGDYMNLTINDTESNKTYTYGASHNATAWFDSSAFVGDSPIFTLHLNTVAIGASNPISNVGQYGVAEYLYTYNTSGNANYSAVSKTFLLNITQLSCDIDLILNDGAADADNAITYGTVPNATATLNIADEAFNLTRNSTLNYTGANSISELDDLGAGVYNYTAYWDGNANVSGCSEQSYLTVYRQGISLSLSPTTETIGYPNTFTQYCADNHTTFDCTLYRDDINHTDDNNTVADLVVGTYVYTANLSAPIENYSYTNPSSTFVVNRGGVSISMWLNGTAGPETITYPDDVNVTCYINISSQNSFTLLMDGTTINSSSGQAAYYIDDLGVAAYNFTCNYSQTQNYLGYMVNYTLTMSQGTPRIPLLIDGLENATHSRVYPNTTHFQISESNVGDSDLTYEISQNTTNQSSTDYTKRLGVDGYNITGFTDGGQNWTANSTTSYLSVTKGTCDIALYLNGGTADADNSIYTSDSSNATATMDATSYYAVIWNLMRNSSASTNGTGTLNLNGTLAEGAYNFTAFFDGDANWTACSEASTLTVSTAPTTTTTTTVPSYYSGGGSSGSTISTDETTVVKSFTSILPGTGKKIEESDLQDTETDLTEIMLDVVQRVIGVTMEIKKLDSKPSSVSDDVSSSSGSGMAAKVYKYLSISTTGISDDQVKEAKIKFKVAKSWVTGEGIDKATIVLQRYKNQQWNALETELLDEDDDYYYFEATSPGFSYFAVSGDSGDTTVTTTTTVPSEATTTTTTQAPAATTTTIEIPPPMKRTDTPLAILFFVAMIIVLIIFLYKEGYIALE